MIPRTGPVVILISLTLLAGCFGTDPAERRDNDRDGFNAEDCIAREAKSVLTPVPTTGDRHQGNVTLQTAFRALDDVKSLARISVGVFITNTTNNQEEASACLAGEQATDTFLMSMRLSPSFLNGTIPDSARQGATPEWQTRPVDLLVAGKADGMLFFLPALNRVISAHQENERDESSQPESFWGSEGLGSNFPVLAPAKDLSEYRNFTVTGAEATTYNGKPAQRVGFEGASPDGTVRGTAILYDAPKRPAAIGYEFDHTQAPSQGEDEGDEGDSGGAGGGFGSGENPVKRGYAQVVFRYDDEVQLELGGPLQRAMALATRSNFMGGDGSEPNVRTIHFAPMNGTTPVPIGEVEFRIAKDTSGQNTQARAYTDADYEFRMPLSQGTKTEGNWTASFSDADGNGVVSRNDTVTVTFNGPRPSDSPFWFPFSGYDLGVYDTTTDLFITPGAGAAPLLATLALVAAVLAVAARRRAA